MNALSLPPFYLSTVLLEANRWTPDKKPSFAVSSWLPAIRKAGFQALELWENHFVETPAEEAESLCNGDLPVAVFNSYCTFDDDGADTRRRAVESVRRLGATGVKFNLGHDLTRIDHYSTHLKDWLDALPAGCKALCECHGGTVLENPANAARILAPFRDRIGIIVHAFAGDDDALRAWISHFGSSISHIHAASGYLPGTGFVPLRSIAAIVRQRIGMLTEAGFNGTVAIEFTAGVASPPESRDRLLAAATDDLLFLREAFAIPREAG